MTVSEILELLTLIAVVIFGIIKRCKRNNRPPARKRPFHSSKL